MIGAIVQARMGSSRLPNKVLLPVLGKPLLGYLLERLQQSTRLEKIIVATTQRPEDDVIESFCKDHSIACYRGSTDDVLDRYYQAAKLYELKTVVRITADCPVLDPEVLDKVIDRFTSLPGIDYVSNTLQTTYPDGLDVEVFSFSFLGKLHTLADKAYQREHVCTYMVEHPEQFQTEVVTNETNLSNHRWTVDNAEDFTLLRSMIEALYPTNPAFRLKDMLAFMESRPDIARINQHIRRNEGFVRSLEQQGLTEDEKKKVIATVLKRPE